MAASIVATPLAMNPVYNPIVFKINLSDLGTETVQKSMYYKIIFTDADSNSFDVYESDPIRPFSASQIFDIDVSRDLQGYVSTSIPSSFGQIIPLSRPDKKIWGKVKIELYEVTKNLEECDSTETLSDTSDEVFVFNGASQDYQVNYLNFPSVVQFLDQRPSVYEIDRNAYDYIWIWGSTSITFEPEQGTPVTISASDQVNIVSMRAYGPYSPTMKYMDVTFDSIEGGKTIRVVFKDDCSNNELHELRNISYLHPYGGRSVITLDEVDELSIGFDQEIVFRYQGNINEGDLSDTLTRSNHAGNTIWNKNVSENVTFIHSTNVDNIEQIEQFKAFLSSSGYLLQARNVGQSNSTMLRKFIVESGSIVYSKSNESVDLVISGRMNNNYLNQKNDR